MAITSRNDAAPGYVLGGWTSTACCATDQTEDVGFPPRLVIAQLDSGGTSPNILIKFADDTDETSLITGTTGVITSPTDATGITISGNTFVVDETSQVPSGTNQYICFR